MGLDIRYPIGMMFTLIGLLLAGTGLVNGGNVSIAGIDIGMNVNLAWGAVLFVFGALMWGSAVRSKGQ
jgi:hypothetical protein